jgi:hypothetical protein
MTISCVEDGRHPAAEAKATLESTFGSVRLWDGRLFVLDAVARDRGLADEVAAQARSRGRLARVTEVGARGVRLGDGERARNVWVVWTRLA